MYGKDLQEGQSELAITSSPLYRFYTTTSLTSYDSYRTYCDNYGFRRMNIINFEVKSKFIKSFIERKKDAPPDFIEVQDEDMPF